MAHGGKRNRSGPPADETSGRSDRRAYSLQALPTEHDIEAPEWPLAKRHVYFTVGKERFLDEDATVLVAERELALWAWAWTKPQAAAWIQPTEDFRIPIVAMWVRTFVICESGEATAADKGSIHRFADQIGMTTAGLAEMGWKIVEGAGAPAPKAEPAPAATGTDGTVTPITAGRRLRG